MFVAFLESIKYTGHLFPIAFLRVFMGYYFLQEAARNFAGDFLLQPRLAEALSESIKNNTAPSLLIGFFEQVAIPYWQVFAYGITVLQFLIGLSFLIGYLVRPFAAICCLLSIVLLWISPVDKVILYKTFIAISITLGWLGAGRCIGFDYYFYKRMRGIWW